MIRKKKRELLELAGRIEIGYVMDYVYLTGARYHTGVRKWLSELCMEGYMVEDKCNGKKVYYLSRKGMSVTETHMRKQYNPRGYTTDHALYIADFASYIHLTEKISNDSFLFDREMEKTDLFKPNRPFSTRERGKPVHAPDFIVGDTCYEVELTLKARSRLKNNYCQNSKYFARQVWLVPRQLKTLQMNLRKYSKEMACPVEIVLIDTMEAYLKNVNLRENTVGNHVHMQIKLPEIKRADEIMEVLQ